MEICIIVEGKNDLIRLRELLKDEVRIMCTFGIPAAGRVHDLVRSAADAQVFLMTDNDDSGRRIRSVLRDAFPDAEHIYTGRGFAGVEGTPGELLIRQLEKAGLEEYILKPSLNVLQQKNDQRNRKYTEDSRGKHEL